LADHIRQQYPFAMIDEFQDTDSLQYEIFNQVYSKEDCSGLYMIGDPKQAIYSFRGADIFTYLKAAQSLDENSRFTLNKNWRSHSDLVAATNTLFSRHNEPFVLPGKIEFQSVLSAGKSDDGYFHYRAADAKAVENSQENKPAPLTLLLNSEGTNRDHGRYNAAAMCANSIQQLLLKGCLKNKESSDSVSGSDDPVTAGDIAVLVHNRKQAKLVKENLKEYGINSVFLSRDSVLNSVEARDLLRWLAAIAEPQNERLFRSALACESLAYDAHYLASLLNDEALWEVELAQLYELRDRFNQRGVMAFIMALLNKSTANKGTVNKATENKGTANSEPLAVRLRKQADGERKLTNFLHLGEVLQQASRELGIQSGFYNTDGKGLLTLLRWYTERCQNAVLHQSEEQQIRLESDANLVQIVTIHKSKGLQYPVVFLPFLWDEDHSSTRHGVMYHSEVANEEGVEGEGKVRGVETVLTIDTQPDEAAKKKHISEVRAEAMRLLYVALTRAEQACFVQIENVQKYSRGTLINSAIGYLFEQKEVSIDALRERFSDVIDEGKLALFYYNDWLIQLDTVPILAKTDSNEKLALTLAKFKGKVWDNWRLTSYSQLAKLDSRLSLSDSGTQFDVDAEDLAANAAPHNKQSADEVLENDLVESVEFESEMLESETLEEKDKALTPFDFPKGASPGTCLHNILENWDFTSHDTLEDQIKKQLTFYGISADLLPMTISWMKQVVAQPLADAQCCLADISEKDRLIEMEFYLPITEDGIRASGVMPLLDGRRLAFEPMRGQLKGFIDLIFRHDGRYYVADYKSNYLGDTIQHYQSDALKEAMKHHQYDLQYWIYSIAVDQYLSHRIPNYDYEIHFGGVYYFFLRGMNGCSDGEGVFFTRPEESQLEKWKEWLLGSADSIETQQEILDKKVLNNKVKEPNSSNNDSQQLGLF
jgi:exodeoxyribonuclease V beta subunit